MADRVIRAEAIISAKDNTGGAFDSISSKIEAMNKKMSALGKNNAAVEKANALTAALKRTGDQLQAIEKYNGAQSAFASMRQKFAATQDAVQRAAQAMKAFDKPSAAMQSAYTRAQDAASRTAAAFDKQKAAAIGAKRALDAFGIAPGRIASEQARLRASIDSTTAAMNKQAAAAERSHRRRESLRTAGAAAGVYLGHKAAHVAHSVLETYEEFDKERRFGRAIMGITDEEQRPLVQQAIRGGATTSYNDIQFLEGQRELAARGLKRDSILGMMGPAANLGMAMDLPLPDAVKNLEGGIFGFQKDISTVAAARAAARQTSDLQVKAAKI